jgi:hypothetical protein
MRVVCGMKFGRLTVLEFAFSKNRLKYWRCQCVCGSLVTVYSGSLTRTKHSTKSCGCLKAERVGDLNRLEDGKSARNRRLSDYRKKAKRKGLPFDLTEEQFFALTQQPCHYCGREPYRTSHTKGTHYHGDFVYNGVDRKDSEQGYVRTNCVPCCHTCNLGKCDSSYEEFVQYLNRVAVFRKSLCLV